MKIIYKIYKLFEKLGTISFSAGPGDNSESESEGRRDYHEEQCFARNWQSQAVCFHQVSFIWSGISLHKDIWEFIMSISLGDLPCKSCLGFQAELIPVNNGIIPPRGISLLLQENSWVIFSQHFTISAHVISLQHLIIWSSFFSYISQSQVILSQAFHFLWRSTCFWSQTVRR